MWKWDKTQKIYWAKKTANLPKIQPIGKKEYEQASTAGLAKWTGNMEDILQNLQVEERLFYPLMRLILQLQRTDGEIIITTILSVFNAFARTGNHRSRIGLAMVELHHTGLLCHPWIQECANNNIHEGPWNHTVTQDGCGLNGGKRPADDCWGY